MMLTMFSPRVFVQYADISNSVYMLVNREMLDRGEVSIPTIEAALSSLYVGDYSLFSD
jgi:hypothetical protein